MPSRVFCDTPGKNSWLVTSVLFGATSVRQLRANCAAVGLIDRLRPEDVAALLRVGLPPALADA